MEEENSSSSEASEGFNFDTAQLENVTQASTKPFSFAKDALLPGTSIVLFAALVFASINFIKKKSRITFPDNLLIKNWPWELRLALVPLISSYLLTHAFSLGSVIYNTQTANPSTEAYFDVMGVGRLFSLSHAHLFAHATMYFLIAALVNLTKAGFFFRTLAPLLALWAGVFDVLSWWGLKKVSPNFEILSAICGSAFSIGFLFMSFAIMRAAFFDDKKPCYP